MGNRIIFLGFVGEEMTMRQAKKCWRTNTYPGKNAEPKIREAVSNGALGGDGHI